MSTNEELVKITSGGTISIPIQFRKYLQLQKGDYVKMAMEQDHIVIKKAPDGSRLKARHAAGLTILANVRPLVLRPQP